MSEIAGIIDTLEGRIEKLFDRIQHLEKKTTILQEELSQSATIIAQQSDEIREVKSQCETLKMTNSLLGSEENKRDTKLKINSLIREIDHCIAQLSD